jgi:predicted nucleotidyltransferase component of viral defense system
MNTIYSPAALGFSSEKHTIDRCQIALLRALAQTGGMRLVLKGGMAMRVAFGGMRLTKDIDFDRSDRLSSNATKGTIRTAMQAAAQMAGIRKIEISVTKDTSTTTRIRLAGQSHDGVSIRFQVEVSGRDEPEASALQWVTVTPPQSYTLAPFGVQTYTLHAMAATKVFAVLADLRNVPRDIADLKILIAFGANPVPFLARREPGRLAALRQDVLGKLTLITFDMAVQELFPYLPPLEVAGATRKAWEDDIVAISEVIDHWLGLAIEQSGLNRPASSSTLARPRGTP